MLEVLKQAFEALEMSESLLRGDYNMTADMCEKSIKSLRQAIEDLEKQDPVAWIDDRCLKDINNFDATVYANGGFDCAVPLYTTPQPLQQEPVTSFDDYCKNLSPFWNTRISRTTAEEFFHAGWLSAQSIKQEPVAWRDHVEQRLLTWRQSFVNRSGDQLALEDFMDKRSLDDLIDFVCDEWTDPQPRKPLTFEQREEIGKWWHSRSWTLGDIIDHVEQAHGIKE
jgi:hypothetical protein